ncbi:MAG: 50S ribosomal protein L9 [Candidatus Omnitrophica bacterium]|nr:50S ribosomal protein L9 [Candidatus Omnitrophota bacterium]
MQVVLKETVYNLGGAGSVVKVKDGYARNFLIPRGLAIPATSGAKRHIEHIQRLAEKKRATEIKDASDLKVKLEALSLTVEAKAGERGKLYGSVTSVDIANAIAEQGIEVDRRKIILDHPLRSLGEHTVRLKIDPEVSAEFKVVVEPSADSDVQEDLSPIEEMVTTEETATEEAAATEAAAEETPADTAPEAEAEEEKAEAKE